MTAVHLCVSYSFATVLVLSQFDFVSSSCYAIDVLFLLRY